MALQQSVSSSTALCKNQLLILADESVRDLYINHQHFHPGDSGIDLYTPEDIAFQPGETKIVDLKIKTQMVNCETSQDVSYYLYPRSSISKTPLRLANSVGIIDSGYRGNIKAALTYIPRYKMAFESGEVKYNLDKEPFYLEKNSRIVQICSPDLSSLNLSIVDSLTETERGSGGFGSTGI